MTREELRRRLEPYTREWGTVHGDIDEILDAVMRGRPQPDSNAPAQDGWDRIMRGSPEMTSRYPLWIRIAAITAFWMIIVGFVSSFFEATKYSLGALFPAGAGIMAIVSYRAARIVDGAKRGRHDGAVR